MEEIKEKILIMPCREAEPTATCYVTPEFFNNSGLLHGSRVSISFGSLTVPATLRYKPERSHDENIRMYLSNDLIRQLMLPDLGYFGIKIHDTYIIVGPLFGVFVSVWEIDNIHQGTCKNKNFIRYLRASEELHGVCCFFCLRDVVWEQQLVKGWFLKLNSEGEEVWFSRVVPIPKVIYDRCFGSRGRIDGADLRAKLIEIPGTIVFNAMPKLKKWEVYQLLTQHPSVGELLPETTLYSTVEELKEFLNRYGRIYLKPVGLSKGQGVFRLNNKSGVFIIEHRGPKGNQVQLIKTRKQLENLMEPFFERGDGYLIQQEIPLSKYNGNVFDMRVLCQKNANGQWVIGGIAVRVAAPRSIITGPRSGGKVISWPTVLKEVFGETEENNQGLAERVNTVALEVCRIIEEHYGCCGELGLDFGIDKDGKIWIIEVNGKPLKVSLKRLDSPDLTHDIYANPIRFACYLASKY